MVAFQIAFRVEKYANNVFLFLIFIFDISTSKRSKKYKSHLILTKKKFKIYQNTSTNTVLKRLLKENGGGKDTIILSMQAKWA